MTTTAAKPRALGVIEEFFEGATGLADAAAKGLDRNGIPFLANRKQRDMVCIEDPATTCFRWAAGMVFEAEGRNPTENSLCLSALALECSPAAQHSIEGCNSWHRQIFVLIEVQLPESYRAAFDQAVSANRLSRSQTPSPRPATLEELMTLAPVGYPNDRAAFIQLLTDAMQFTNPVIAALYAEAEALLAGTHHQDPRDWIFRHKAIDLSLGHRLSPLEHLASVVILVARTRLTLAELPT